MPDMTDIGWAAQALITDPLVGTASGYALVARSPGLAPADASWLERQPFVSDFLHLLPEKRSFFAAQPLPSGAWVLTRRFGHGLRRGSFNRVVVHALVVAAELWQRLEDPLVLRALAAFGQNRESLIQIGDRLAASDFGAGVLLLEDLKICLPHDYEAARRREVLAQRQLLINAWGAAAFENRVVRALTALASGRLWLEQNTLDELFLGFLVSLLPKRDRCQLAFSTHLPIEARESFRLAALEDASGLLSRLPPGHGTFTLENQAPRQTQAEALAELTRDPEIFEQWLRAERDLGASLFEGQALAYQIALFRHGEAFLLEGFAEWSALEAFLERAGRAAARSTPTFLLSLVIATLLRQLERAAAETLLGTAVQILDRERLDELITIEQIDVFAAEDPGKLGAEGLCTAIGLALRARRFENPALERLAQLFPSPALERTTPAFRELWRAISTRLVEALSATGSLQTFSALRQLSERFDLAAETRQRLITTWLPRLETLDADAEAQIEVLSRLLTPELAPAWQDALERRALRLGRQSALILLRRLEATLATSRGLDAEKLSVALLGQLGARLEGLELLASQHLTEAQKLRLELFFLPRLLEKLDGETLLRRFLDLRVFSGFGLEAQNRIAAAVGAAAAKLSPPSRECLTSLMRGKRMDLVGAFLRGAGPGFLGRLDSRRDAGVLTQLQTAWTERRARLDLLPFGAEIRALRPHPSKRPRA